MILTIYNISLTPIQIYFTTKKQLKVHVQPPSLLHFHENSNNEETQQHEGQVNIQNSTLNESIELTEFENQAFPCEEYPIQIPKMVANANSGQEDGESSYQETSFIETKQDETIKTNIFQNQGELYG